MSPNGSRTTEQDARIIIDRKLREAGWDIEDKNHVSTEDLVKDGRADYFLKDSRGRAMALIEAKRFSVDPVSAKQQALTYAEEMKIDFIFLSNGEDIYFWDYKHRPEQKRITATMCVELFPDISRPTINNDLSKMQELGLIHSGGASMNTYYEPNF